MSDGDFGQEDEEENGDGDGNDDVTYDQAGDKYGFTSGGETTTIIYGGENSQQVSYSATVDAPSEGISPVLADLVNNKKDSSKLLGTTLTDEDSGKYLEIDLTIWVEGWQQFANSSIWDADYIDSQFDIGFEFATDID